MVVCLISIEFTSNIHLYDIASNGFLFFNGKIQNGYAMNTTYGRIFSFKNQTLNQHDKNGSPPSY